MNATLFSCKIYMNKWKGYHKTATLNYNILWENNVDVRFNIRLKGYNRTLFLTNLWLTSTHLKLGFNVTNDLMAQGSKKSVSGKLTCQLLAHLSQRHVINHSYEFTSKANWLKWIFTNNYFSPCSQYIHISGIIWGQYYKSVILSNSENQQKCEGLTVSVSLGFVT